MLMPIVAVVPVLLAGAAYALLRRKKSAAPSLRVFRCPSCKQQIRFAATQAGRKGNCPRCWKAVTPPQYCEAVEPTRRVIRMQRPVYGRLTSTTTK
jgi:uncharacterized paraquat-inducible protein A